MQLEDPTSLTEIETVLERGIIGADQERAQGLVHLQTVRRARQKQLQREQTRLAEKLGAEHPRVLALTARAEINHGLAQDLALEIGRAQVTVPAPDATTWVVHGFVRDLQRQGIPQLTIALYTPTGVWARDLGFACTNEKGYFNLEARQVKVDPARQVQLRVLNAERATLYQDQASLSPGGGDVAYREITLDPNKPVCTPPEPTKGAPGPGDFQPPLTDDPLLDPDVWMIRGRVTDQTGRGLSGLVVSLYDQDLFFDDRLGQVETDAEGNFHFRYRTEDFRDLIERKPDLYLKVLDQQGTVLHTENHPIRSEAGREEIFHITIPR